MNAEPVRPDTPPSYHGTKLAKHQGGVEVRKKKQKLNF
jgi:hypothetical protein